MEQNIHEYLRSRSEELVRTGMDGKSVSRILTEFVDKLIISACEDTAIRHNPPLPPFKKGGINISSPLASERNPLYPPLLKGDEGGLALVAVGGYGRMEIAAYSDIDIMLLSNKRDPALAEAAQSILYRLWDLGLDISHSFRTLNECIEDSMSDLKTRTSLIESRFLAGDRNIFDEFKRDVYQKLLFRNKKAFVRDILSEIDRRHKAFGGSVYLLEPNVKEGQGGLRDIHSISWLARAALRTDTLKGLAKALPENDYRHFMKAYDFVLKTRLCLHSSSKRRNDILSFEFQETVAGMFGFKNTKRFLCEEILMRLYYKKAENIINALKKIMNISSRQYFSFRLSPFIKKVTDNFYISGGEIIVRDRDIFKNTDKIMEAFYIYSITGRKFSHQVRERIRNRFLFINKKTRTSPKAVEYFLKILKGDRAHETLKEMHNTGILDRFIPEFGRLRHLVLYEPYHRYTVDEHTLIALKNAEMLKQTSHKRLQYLSDMLKGIKQEVLYLSILLHDIGKGLPEKNIVRHEGSGYRLLKEILERFNIDGNDRRRIEFLVKNHILLSRLALTRDSDAPETITQLAGIAETEENLNALYLMTYADMSAVNPYFLTEWKALLFYNVYKKTIEHIQGVRGRYFSMPDKRLEEFVSEMPDRYLVSNADEAIRADYLLSLDLNGEGVSVSIKNMPDGSAEIIIATTDMPGLFSKIVGALSFRGLNIVRARLYTGKSSVVIDKISVSNWNDIWWQGMEEQIREDLKKAILQPGQGAIRQPGYSCSLPVAYNPLPFSKRLENFVEIDNETSDEYTILELFLPDSIGLLYDISTRFYERDIDIISAVINTEDNIAQDVFYLQCNSAKLEAGAISEILCSIRNSEFWGYEIKSLP